ncbi:MAG: amidophosphoribosyltransferase [Planctomycetes bacterium]|nr:amidophosphoribosyltransferase [Planctomycetota bacterium]
MNHEGHDLGHKCGIFAISDHPNASELAYYGLYSLQHRGQESAGIAADINGRIKTYVGMGLVGDVFQDEFFEHFNGARSAIGHTRYSTSGSSNVKNAQPITVDTTRGQIAVAHNGNLTNGWALREELEAQGSIFQTTSDSEVILHLLARPDYARLPDAWTPALNRLEGAFCYVGMREGALIAVRDPHGYRPLCIGRLGDSWVFASESCAFDMIGATYEDNVKPGEIVTVRNGELERKFYAANQSERKEAQCIFEHVYFARPDSTVFGHNVHLSRLAMGRALARECPADADLVVPVPDSGNSAAQGYAMESGIPLDQGFVRNHYVGRSFIQPSQNQRDIAVKIKLNANRSVVEGKRLVVVDDSVIRGTTSKSRVQRLREAGAKEIHLRISCPPTRHPCYFGIDFPDPKQLIANNKTIEEIRDFLEIESLGYLSVQGMVDAMGDGDRYCTACFSGEYRSQRPAGFEKHAKD